MKTIAIFPSLYILSLHQILIIRGIFRDILKKKTLTVSYNTHCIYGSFSQFFFLHLHVLWIIGGLKKVLLLVVSDQKKKKKKKETKKKKKKKKKRKNSGVLF